MTVRRLGDVPEGGTATTIGEAAMDLFARNGYEATSMREIAAASGIRAPSLYNHFSSKDDLLSSLTRAALDELERTRTAAAGALPADASATDRLICFVGAMVRFHVEHSRAAIVINSHLRSLSNRRYRQAVYLRDRHQKHLLDILEAGVATGEFACPDVRVTGYAILQMATGPSTWFKAGGALSVDRLCDIYADLSVRMVGAGSDVSRHRIPPTPPEAVT